MASQQFSDSFSLNLGQEVHHPDDAYLIHEGPRHACQTFINETTGDVHHGQGNAIDDTELIPAPLRIRRPAIAPAYEQRSALGHAQAPYATQVHDVPSRCQRGERADAHGCQTHSNHQVNHAQVVNHGEVNPPLRRGRNSTVGNLRQYEEQTAEPISTSPTYHGPISPPPEQIARANRYGTLPHSPSQFDSTRFYLPNELLPHEQLTYRPRNVRDSMSYIDLRLGNTVEHRLQYRYYVVEPYISIAGRIKEIARYILHPRHTEFWARSNALYNVGPSNY